MQTYKYFVHFTFVTTCFLRYKKATGENLSPENFFVIFEFSQSNSNLDNIGVITM